MSLQQTRRAFLGVVAGTCMGGAAFAQSPGDPYRVVEPVTLPLDKPGIYTLNFRYAPPRIVTVEQADKTKKQVWYLFFQVYNRTDGPQEFYPEFELVAKDLNQTFLDEPQPFAVKSIRDLEDRTGALDLQTSISISKSKIPVTKPDSVPRYVSGIAVWTDVTEKASKTNRFSVYVSGLSNGVATVERANDKTLYVKRKVLRLDFFKPTNDTNPGVGDIRIEDNGGLGGEKWEYRFSSIRKPATAAPTPEKKDGN